jgi:hypothetical protein
MVLWLLMDTTSAAKKPARSKPPRQRRMALTLPPDLLAALTDLAAATGRPATSLAVGFLKEMVPMIHEMAKIQRLMEAGKSSQAQRAFRHMVGDGMAAVLKERQPDLFKSVRGRK